MNFRIKTFVNSFGLLSIFTLNSEFEILNTLLSPQMSSGKAEAAIDLFKKLSLKAFEEIKADLGDWDPDFDRDENYGAYIHIIGDERFVLYYNEIKELYIESWKDGKFYRPQKISFELINTYLKFIHEILIRFEQPESFPIFPNMLTLVNKRYSRKLEALGFRCVGQTADMVRFAKDWLFVDLLEDRDGAVLFFTDQRNNERYEFNMALELLDWDAGNMHALLCQKYISKLPREEARTGIMEATFEYLESHFNEILQTLDEAFFIKLEEEGQLRTEMLRRVLLLPSDHIIRRLFVDGSPVWWEYMRQEMKDSL